MSGKKGGESFVLCSPRKRGGPLSKNALHDELKRLCENEGIRKIPFHGLRHTNASLLLLQNVHPKVVVERWDTLPSKSPWICIPTLHQHYSGKSERLWTTTFSDGQQMDRRVLQANKQNLQHRREQGFCQIPRVHPEAPAFT